MLTTTTPATVGEWLRQFWCQGLFRSAADTMTRPRLLSLLVVLILPAMLLYPCLSFHLFEPDEGRYAQIPAEMYHSGHWVVPTLQGEPYLDKPPLFYWLVTLSYKAFGVSEASARLVPALCVHLTILAIYWLGRRSVGERAAFWAALLLTVAPGFLGIARLLLLDGLLSFLVTTSVLCGFEAIRTGQFKRSWWLAAAVCSGLGFLTKGPISEVLLFPPLLVFGLLHRDAAKVSWYDALFFGCIVLLVNLPWYILMGLQQPEFLGYFFWEHNVMRFVKPFDHLQPVWYYLPILLVGLLPGTLLAVPYLRSLWRGDAGHRSRSGGFWLLAGLWCVAFFSVSGSKLPTYILPAYPLLCLALGEFVARSRYDHLKRTRVMIVCFAGLLAGLHYVAIPWYAKERSPLGKPEFVLPHISDPNTPVVSYPRNLDSVAFYTGRANIHPVRTKDVNELIRQAGTRPYTVVLFTHDHSLEGFKETLRGAIGTNVVVHRQYDLRRKDGPPWLDKLLGGGPWGLCDIAIIGPNPNVKPRTPNPITPVGFTEPTPR